MKHTRALAIIAIFFSSQLQAQDFREMMHDYRYNFYDVVRAAEQHFAVHPKGKGSGWKDYERWRYENENKFAPSGRRDNVSPYFVEEALQKIRSSLPVNASRAAQPVWEDMGPYDAENVTSHYSQGIGRVEWVYANPTNPQLMYMGSRSGGFWRTANGGQTWECTTDTMFATGVNTIGVSPTNSDTVYINVRNARNGYSHGIYRSYDGGRSWSSTVFNPTNLNWGGLGKTGQVHVIVVSPHDPQLILIGSDKGLFRSTDALASYSLIKTGNYTQVTFHPTQPSKIYAYDKNDPNKNVVMISSDSGTSFIAGGTITGNNNNTSVRLSVSPVCPGCLWFASNSGIWKSGNEGMTYTKLSDPSESCAGFAVSDLDTSAMIYGYVDVYGSGDGGRNFTQRTYWSTGNSNHIKDSNYVHADMRHAICVNGVFYIGTDGYMCSSTDNGNVWTRRNDGTGVREFYRLGISQSDPHLTMAGSQDNGTSIYNISGWLEWNGGDGMEAIVHTLNNNWMIGSWQYGNRNRTTNGGQTRHSVKHSGSPDWNAPMFYDPNHQFRVYSFSNQVHISDNYGTNWTTGATIPSGVAQKASVAENNSQIILISRGAKLYLSTDGGQTLSDISASLPNTASISDFAFDPTRDSTVVLVYNTYQSNIRRVYISDDLCNTWKNISFNLSPMPARDVVLDDRGNLYVGCEIGVYTMHRDSNIWMPWGKGLPNVTAEELEIQWATNQLRVVTWGRGMWQTKLKGRENHPEITKIAIDQTPNTTNAPAEDFPQYVTANITHDAQIDKAWILWSRDAPSLHNSILMERLTGNTWRSVQPIPDYTNGTDIYFKVYAVGAYSDTTASYKFNYTYRPCSGQPNINAIASKTSICQGDSVVLTASGASIYQWADGIENGSVVKPNQTTTYYVKGWSAGTCAGSDSITISVDTIDTRVLVAGPTLSAYQLGGTYRWLDCRNNLAPIAAATGMSYTGTENGEYAVEITLGACTDTSDCMAVIPSGINTYTSLELLQLFPNPVGKSLTIQTQSANIEQVLIRDISGRQLQLPVHVSNNSSRVETETLTPGIYLAEVWTKHHKFTLRFVVQHLR